MWRHDLNIYAQMEDFPLDNMPSNRQQLTKCNSANIFYDQNALDVMPDGCCDSSGFSVGGRGRQSHHASISQQLPSGVSDLFGDCRNVMRLAYKQLKADGPHLFDFSEPFSAPVNQMVASRVADLARTLPQCKNWDETTWQSEV